MPEQRGSTKQTRIYTEDERKTALELATTIGIAAAARNLDVGRKTIYRWIDQYPEYWHQLRANDPASQRKGFATRLEDLADRYVAAEQDLIARIETGEIQANDPKEAAALLKAMGSSRQAATVGARGASGEPEVHEHRIDFSQLESAMEKLLGAPTPPPALQVPNEAATEDVQ